MPPRPRACCRAVQRQLSPFDSIWVSDDALCSAFHRLLVISRPNRRHGSSVPGPMESRRRLGRRRIAHLSEAFPTTPHAPTSLWGSLGDIDRAQWQWQAPTRPPNKTESAFALPSWLSQWDTSPKGASSELLDIKESPPVAFQYITPADDILRSFRSTLQNVLLDDISGTCDEFTQRFKQSLALGLVSDETLNSALQLFTVDIRRVAPNLDFAESQCLTFYRAIWEGIMACKVVRPIDFSAHIMNRLLSLLAQLPLTKEAKTLARSVLHSTSTTQLRDMIPGINMLINTWSQTWLLDIDAIDCTPLLTLAEKSVQVVATRIIKAHKLIVALEEGPDSEERFAMTQKALHGAQMAIFEAIEATIKVDSLLLPFKSSVECLAEALSNVPGELLSSIVSSCSDQIAAICDSMEGSTRAFRFYWLSLIARMPKADHRALLGCWRKLEIFRGRLTDCQTSDLVLNHWISQGYVENACFVRNRFEAWGSRHQDFITLLLTPDKQRQGRQTNPEPLFSMLRRLGRYEMVCDILSRMLDLGMKVSVDVLVQTLDTTSSYSPRLALSLYKRYLPAQFGYQQLPVDQCPNFVTAMIKDATISPRVIWATLKIPLYEELPPRPVSSKILTPSMVNLIHSMATEFARSEGRSRRVLLRNVMQCLHHLRIHRAPIRSELTRAIAHVGITKEVVREQWIGQERLRWALGLITWVEGQDVADAIDRTVYHWRRHLTENRRHRRREENVLHVGPID